MRHIWLGGVVLLSLSGWFSVAAGESDVYQLPKSAKKASWWWPFGGSKEAEAKPPAKQTPADPPKPKATDVPRPSPGGGIADDQEYKSFLRRQLAAIRLQEVADELNDPALRIQAQELEDRAWRLYLRRTGQAASSSVSPAEEREMARKLLEETRKAAQPPSDRHVSDLGPAAERPIRSIVVPPLPGEKEE